MHPVRCVLIFVVLECFLFTVSHCTHDPEKRARRERKRQEKRNRFNFPSPLPGAPIDQVFQPTNADAFDPLGSFGSPSESQCYLGSTCTRIRDCPFQRDTGNQIQCTIGQNIRGICCPTTFTPEDTLPSGPPVPPRPPLPPLPPSRPPAFNFPIINPASIAKAFQEARSQLQRTQRLETTLQEKRLFATSRSEEGQHQNFLTVGNRQEASQMSRIGELILIAAKALAKSFNINLNQLPQVVDKKVALSFANSVTDECPQEIACSNNSLYRSADGSCNNVRHGDWGKSFTPFNRLAVPVYDNSFDTPRTRGKSGNELPNVRAVSTTVALDESRPSNLLSYAFMQWGQFIDHDLTGTATSRSQSGQSIRCCGPEFDADASLIHPSCFAIKVPKDDPFYSQFNRQCISFVRSAAAVRPGCSLGPREQLNQLTAYIDGGMVYGKTDNSAASLRTFTGGLLRSSTIDGNEFLPQSKSTCSIPRERNQFCFQAGDSRVNVAANLVALHAIFLRHHNNIARILRQLNNHWSDETLYQETRKIVIAQIQHITYNEFLPLLLSPETIQQFNLKLSNDFTYSYDDRVNAQIISSFATAAYRLHTLIPSIIKFTDSQGSGKGKLDLSETYFNPSVLYERRAFETIVYGMSDDSSQSIDTFHSSQITNHLFRGFGSAFGSDLVSLNIQRGRDHALPPYNEFRRICKLAIIKSWSDLNSLMTPRTVQRLSSLYESVDDIDLFVAGVAEKPMANSILGETFNCIIGEQFKRLKIGDRFWYENGNFIHSFTRDQLREIKKISLARVLCDSGPNIQVIQPFVLAKSNVDWNGKQYCNSPLIPSVDYSMWKQ